MSDYRWTPIGEPRFPDGPVLHLFDDYPQAHSTLGRELPLFHRSRDGKLLAVWMTGDAEVLMGVNPSFVVDHTTRPWPDAWVTLVALRAGRANAQVARAEDVVRALADRAIHVLQPGDANPCDTDAQEAAPGVKAPDRGR